MNRSDFLSGLRVALKGLPEAEIAEHVHFYSEMICDRMEDGLSEEEAVAQVGSVDEVVAQILSDTAPAKPAEEKVKAKKALKAWEIVLLVLGSPLWLSLLIGALSVVITLYACIWTAVVCLWAAFASLVGGALAGLLSPVALALSGNDIAGLAMLGAGLVCAGAAVFVFFGCRAASVGVVVLTKKVLLATRNLFVGKRCEK